MNTSQVLVANLLMAWLVPAMAEWHCIARDDANHEWSMSSSYERLAINKAFDECKKESNVPETCKITKQECELIVDGHSNRPMWRCVALDQLGKAWESNLYEQRNDAALAAKAYCQQRSGFPDTCYVNLITCQDINSPAK